MAYRRVNPAIARRVAEFIPSTTWGEEEWAAALVADDSLYFSILRGIGLVVGGEHGMKANSQHRDRRREDPERVTEVMSHFGGAQKKEAPGRPGR